MRMMTRLITAVLAIFFVCGPAYGIRCANDIISTGDTDMAVRLKLENCGEIIDRRVIKKEITSNADAKNHQDVEINAEERLVERWYIRVSEQGGKYCYPLTFSEGILKEIGNWTKCD